MKYSIHYLTGKNKYSVTQLIKKCLENTKEEITVLQELGKGSGLFQFPHCSKLAAYTLFDIVWCQGSDTMSYCSTYRRFIALTYCATNVT